MKIVVMIWAGAIATLVVLHLLERELRQWADRRQVEVFEHTADFEWALAEHRVLTGCECLTYEEFKKCASTR